MSLQDKAVLAKMRILEEAVAQTKAHAAAEIAKAKAEARAAVKRSQLLEDAGPGRRHVGFAGRSAESRSNKFMSNSVSTMSSLSTMTPPTQAAQA